MKKRKTRWKLLGAFLLIIVAAFGGLWLLGDYEMRKREWQIDALARGLKEWEKQDHERAMADTYGGRTPQETLQMYINAVEKGDYELASRYFIQEKQESELIKLQNSKKEDTNNVLTFLKQGVNAEGSFSEDNKKFIIRKPIFINFVLYPNALWKIIEI